MLFLKETTKDQSNPQNTSVGDAVHDGICRFSISRDGTALVVRKKGLKTEKNKTIAQLCKRGPVSIFCTMDPYF